MPLFYHVQRKTVPNFSIGKVYNFGREQNFFCADLFAVNPCLSVRGLGDMPIDAIVRDYFDESGFNHYLQVKSPNYTAGERGLLGSAAVVLTHQSMLLRELFFEQVRLESFASKPSRFCCAWLIPHDERLLKYWCASAPNGEFRAYEIEANGSFHVGASKFLKPACLGGNVLRENAQRFWSDPVDALSEPAEILFAGDLIPIRELKMEGSNETTWKKLKRLF